MRPAHTSLCRRFARAPQGVRNHGRKITLLAALTPDGISPSMSITGAIDSAAFAGYIQTFLAPSL